MGDDMKPRVSIVVKDGDLARVKRLAKRMGVRQIDVWTMLVDRCLGEVEHTYQQAVSEERIRIRAAFQKAFEEALERTFE